MLSPRGRSGPMLAPPVLLLTGVLVVTGALAGCSDATDSGSAASSSAVASTTTANIYEQQRAEGVTRLLDALTESITSGDEREVGRLLDAAATTDFRDRFETAAANLRASGPSSGGGAGAADSGPLRFARFRYQLAPTEEAETLVPAAIQDRLVAAGSSDAWVAPVELRYALGGQRAPGVDEPEVVVATQFVVARYGDEWKLVGDSALLDADPTPVQLWELPGLAASDAPTAGGTSVIASYPETSTTVRSLRRQLPGAVDAVTAFWGPDWQRRAVLVTTAEAGQFEALVARSRGVTGTAAAATIFSRVDFPQRIATGQRVVFTPAANDLAEPTLAVVLRHELTHVAARTQTAFDAPLWITEGVAEYVGRKGTYRRLADAAPDLAAAVRAGARPDGLPDDAMFATNGPSSQIAYQSAWSVAAYVADRYGEARLKKLYLGVAESAQPERRDAAIRSALGVDRTQLVADWRRWLDGQVG
ncbi:hypothetical protein ACN93_05085 [Gordonia paraffinivorans]|uniref:hypothetical protein n=1 Tax=Gordonia paraffinivorans TaxID=175628 RepID=UPI000D60CEFF|nr:hypothetical protein [Gordonia paraffinivorans]PWD43851.1 hypothetical protein ACN93_05085 [Gordonia paraffinivorans]